MTEPRDLADALAQLAEARDIQRGLEASIQELTGVIGEQRARLDSIRGYAQHLHRMAEEYRAANPVDNRFLAHVHHEIANTLERKIGDRDAQP